MNKKWYPFVLIVVLGIALLFVKKCGGSNKKSEITTNDKSKDPASDVNRNRGFDRRISYIEYTAHAKCRMQLPAYFAG